jgi:hypothetical protein
VLKGLIFGFVLVVSTTSCTNNTIKNNSVNSFQFDSIHTNLSLDATLPTDTLLSNKLIEITESEYLEIPFTPFYSIDSSYKGYMNPKDESNEIQQYNYLGGIKEWNLSFIYFSSAASAYATLCFQDNISKCRVAFESPFDEAMDVPCLSPKGNFWFSSVNDVFNENNCYMVIYKVENKEGRISFQNSAAFLSKQFYVTHVKWINEDSLAIGTSKVNLEDTTNQTFTQYFKFKW